MLIQIHTDSHIRNNDALRDEVRSELEGALTRRFADRLQRLEIHLQDVNGHKTGSGIRCGIEAHLGRLPTGHGQCDGAIGPGRHRLGRGNARACAGSSPGPARRPQRARVDVGSGPLGP